MHTIKDALEHYFYLIVGKENSKEKSVQCEKELKLEALRASAATNKRRKITTLTCFFTLSYAWWLSRNSVYFLHFGGESSCLP